MSAKILNAPSGQKVTLDGTEAVPITGSQYALISAIRTLAVGAGTVAITAGKAFAVTASLTLAGTDGTTQTFPTTSATIARTDAAQTFTGVQTFSTPIATGSVATMTATVGGGVPTPPNNTTTFLRGDGTFAAPAASSLTVGSTAISGGTTTRILYDNAGVLGEYTLTGTGTVVVMQTSASLITPALGIATATSLNKVVITAPATSATLTILDGKTFQVSNTLTFTATDGSTVNFGAGGTLAYTSSNLSVFAATTSAQLAGVISDETGSGLLVFATSPTLTTPVLGVATATSIAIGGATLGANALAVTGATTLGGNLLFTPVSTQSIGTAAVNAPLNIQLSQFLTMWNGNSTTQAIIFGSANDDGRWFIANANQSFVARIGVIANSTIQHGNFNSNAPVAQTVVFGEKSRVGTDNNIGGSSGTLQSGRGTGTGTLASLIFQSPSLSASGTGIQNYVTGLTILAGAAVLTSYTVANLPAAGTAGAGALAFVTDASTTLILGLGGTVTGGGANKVPVYSDGTNWIYG